MKLTDLSNWSGNQYNRTHNFEKPALYIGSTGFKQSLIHEAQLFKKEHKHIGKLRAYRMCEYNTRLVR